MGGSTTATITDTSAGAGTTTLTLTAGGTVPPRILNGTAKTLALRVTNGNGNFLLTGGASTFSGGIVLAHNASGTRMSPGTIAAGAYGTGAITVGEAATDKAGILFATATQTLTNPVISNTVLGTDRPGTFRIDNTGIVLSGQLTAGLAPVAFTTSGGTGTVTASGKITGTNGLTLVSHALAGGTSLTLTVSNATNDYAGDTIINQNPQTGKAFTLALGAANVIPNGTGKGNVTINTSTTGVGRLNLGGFSETINGLSGNGTVDGVSGTPTLTLGSNDATGVFTGPIVNAAGTNTLSGATTLAQGTITVTGTGAALGTSAVATSAGSTLIYNISGTTTMAQAVTGAGTLRKQGSGTLTFSGAGADALPNQVVVESGIMQITSGGFDSSRMNGAGVLTVNSGATLVLNSTHSLGGSNYAMGESATISGTLTLNEEQYFTNLTLSGALINGDDELRATNGSNWMVVGTSPSSITTLTSLGYANANWNVADVTGDAATDLNISGVITGGYALVKSGAGTLRLSGINTYTGSTVVNAGTLELADNARMRFAIGNASGTSNSISGAGTAVLNGDFAIDLSATALLTSGTWVLENVPSLTGAYGSTFQVVETNGTPWTDAGSDKWTKTVGTQIWSFDETTGTLSLIQSGYDAWASMITNAADRDRTDDPDGDGFTNIQEFLFGTSPIANSGSLVQMTRTEAGLVLRWLQRETNATYTLKHSTTLDSGSWEIVTSPAPVLDADQTGAPTDYDYHTVTLPVGGDPRDFYRIVGAEN